MKNTGQGRLATLVYIGMVFAAAVPALANVPPDTPLITEPAVDDQIVNKADVHMEATPFSDPDVGDDHLCSDWEIWLVSPSERVWFTSCIGGVERLHSHLGDGIFENSHADFAELLPDTQYFVRTRHRDDSGEPATEWSPWAERQFLTSPGFELFPMTVEDIDSTPAPERLDGTGSAIDLPAPADPPRLRLESPTGDLLLELRGLSGSGNLVTNPAGLPDHVSVRCSVAAGSSAGLTLPESDLRVVDDDGRLHTILLPAIDLPAGQQSFFWIASDGSSYFGDGIQTEPDFTLPARLPVLPWIALEAGYAIELVATGFQLPVNIAFKPDSGLEPQDPFFYVTELYGTIKVVTKDGSVGDFATNLLDFNPTGNFPGSGEQGLTGVVIDGVTGDVFASLLYDSTTNPGTHYPKVVRFTSTDGGLTAATQTTILDMVGETQGQSHQISNLSIGPDGKLYVHMGDGFTASTAQDLDSYRGKILRMNFDGSAPADNPFFNLADGINSRDYVYAYGFRNPFGGAWRHADSTHYEVENGPSTDRFARVIQGQNYLWDGTNGSMSSMAIHNWNPAVAPVNIVFVERENSCGSGMPASKFDHAFVTESGPTYATGPQAKGKRITEFVLDAGGNVVSGPDLFVDYVGSGKATAAALAVGPDGLYFSDLYKDQGYLSPIDPGANVWRIRSLTPSLPALDLDGDELRWATVPTATGYDVISGDLATLRATGGDYQSATLACTGNDVAGPSLIDTTAPLAGEGVWYLIREIYASGTGCYESRGPGQLGTRDPEAAAAVSTCP